MASKKPITDRISKAPTLTFVLQYMGKSLAQTACSISSLIGRHVRSMDIDKRGIEQYLAQSRPRTQNSRGSGNVDLPDCVEGMYQRAPAPRLGSADIHIIQLFGNASALPRSSIQMLQTIALNQVIRLSTVG